MKRLLWFILPIVVIAGTCLIPVTTPAHNIGKFGTGNTGGYASWSRIPAASNAFYSTNCTFITNILYSGALLTNAGTYAIEFPMNFSLLGAQVKLDSLIYYARLKRDSIKVGFTHQDSVGTYPALTYSDTLRGTGSYVTTRKALAWLPADTVLAAGQIPFAEFKVINATSTDSITIFHVGVKYHTK